MKLKHYSGEALRQMVADGREHLAILERQYSTPPATGYRNMRERRAMQQRIGCVRNFVRYREQALLERAAAKCVCGAMAECAA